jgi:hypothetical protein
MQQKWSPDPDDERRDNHDHQCIAGFVHRIRGPVADGRVHKTGSPAAVYVFGAE